MMEKEKEVMSEYLDKQWKLQCKTVSQLAEVCDPQLEVFFENRDWFQCWEIEKNLVVGFF